MSDELDRTSIHLKESLGESRTLQANVRQLQNELDNISFRVNHIEYEFIRITRGISSVMQVLQDQGQE